MKKMNNKGFSLIELIIVIAIMAVLVAIIAPNLTKYLGKSKKQTDKTNLKEIENQVRNAISNGATEEPEVLPQTADGTPTTYILAGGSGSAVTVRGGNASFASLLTDVLDNSTVIKSKAEPAKTTIAVTITGTASGGYSISVSHS